MTLVEILIYMFVVLRNCEQASKSFSQSILQTTIKNCGDHDVLCSFGACSTCLGLHH